MSKRKTVLVADVPAGQITLHNVLGEQAELLHASTLDEAMEVMAKVDMIICGIHFDESRMFDLLRLCQAEPSCRTKPVVCFRDLESELAPALFESLDIACKALGAAAFVDLFALKKKFGIVDADQAFREIIFRGLERSVEAR